MAEFLNNVQAVLFDKDGTLIDYDASWLPVNREAARLAANGDAALADRLLRSCGTDPVTGRTKDGSLFAAGNAAEIAARMVEEGAKFAVTTLTERLDTLFAEAASRAVPICDLAPVMEILDRPLGLATSDNEQSACITLKTLGIADRFAFVAGYDSGHGAKPGPGMALAFARAVGCEPRHVAVVGDNTHDLEMARTAGAVAIGVLSGTGTRAALEPLADAVIGSVADLPALIPPVEKAAPRTH